MAYLVTYSYAPILSNATTPSFCAFPILSIGPMSSLNGQAQACQGCWWIWKKKKEAAPAFVVRCKASKEGQVKHGKQVEEKRGRASLPSSIMSCATGGSPGCAKPSLSHCDQSPEWAEAPLMVEKLFIFIFQEPWDAVWCGKWTEIKILRVFVALLCLILFLFLQNFWLQVCQIWIEISFFKMLKILCVGKVHLCLWQLGLNHKHVLVQLGDVLHQQVVSI